MIGDQVETALALMGITKQRVSNWLGIPCNCDQRKQKLNKLHAWARMSVKVSADKAKQYIEKILK